MATRKTTKKKEEQEEQEPTKSEKLIVVGDNTFACLTELNEQKAELQRQFDQLVKVESGILTGVIETAGYQLDKVSILGFVEQKLKLEVTE